MARFNPRTIPDNLGGSENLFDDFPLIGQVEFYDGLIAFGPSLLFFFVFNSLNPGIAILGNIIVGITVLLALIGFIILAVKPNYISLTQLLKNYRDYRNRVKECDGEITKVLQTEGGEIDINETTDGFEVVTDDTRPWIGIKKLYPNLHAVERVDGDLVGMIEIQGLNLDTSKASEKADYVKSFGSFLGDQEYEYEIQLYSTNKKFDPAPFKHKLEQREETSTVKKKEMLEKYIDSRKEWLDGLGEFYLKRFYLIVTVSEQEVFLDSANQSEVEKNLRNLPGGEAVSGIMSGYLGGGSKRLMSEKEVKNRQAEILSERLQKMKSGVDLSENQKVSRLNTDEMGVLLKEFWEGINVRESEEEDFIRKSSFTMRDKNGDKE